MGIGVFYYISSMWLLLKQWLAYSSTSKPWRPLYFKSNAGSTDLVRNQKRKPVLLPLDLIEHIADFLFEISCSSLSGDKSDRTPILLLKPSWGTIAGFMYASVDLHEIGMKRWVQLLTFESSKDLGNASQYAHWVRELRCLNGPPLDSQYGRSLNQFNRLHTLSLDLHSDIHHNGRRFAYRDVFTSLPPSLRRLQIRNAHGPDVKIIATVKKCCPDLQELRLGRCNMFNSSPACEFWRSFPFEHDSYVSNDGTDEYASSLAQELAPLHRLKTLEVGIYLIPTSVVLAHRIYHVNKLPAPHVINWQMALALAKHAPESLAGDAIPPDLEPASADELVDLLHQPNLETDFDQESCQFCRSEFLQASIDAELSATRMLKRLLPSLSEVQWQSWFTPNHLGISSHSL